MIKLNETQYRQLLGAVMKSDNGPGLSEEKVNELISFYEKSYQPIEQNFLRLINGMAQISVDDILRHNTEIIEQYDNLAEKLESTLYEFGDEIDNLMFYLSDSGGPLYEQSSALQQKYKNLNRALMDVQILLSSLGNIADSIADHNINFEQYLESPAEISEGNIDEKFVSKAQQKYFYAKAGDESLSKAERDKWKSMASEFSSKTDYNHLLDKA